VENVLGDIIISVHGERETSILELLQKKNYHWYSSYTEVEDRVKVYKAVVSADGALVGVGDYVAYTDNEYDKV